MTALLSTRAKNVAVGAVADDLAGGFKYYFAGPVPATADEALDMDNDHTEVVKMSVDGDGSTGLTFDGPTAGVISKPSGDVWEGPVAFDGAEPSPGVLTPTFYRICGPGDNGRGAASGTQSRIQDTVGGPASAAAVRLGTETVEDNGSNTQGISGWTFSLGGP